MYILNISKMKKIWLIIYILATSITYTYANNASLFNEVRDEINTICEQLDDNFKKIDEKFNSEFILYVVSDKKQSVYQGIAIGDFKTNMKVFGIQLNISDKELIISPNSDLINDRRLKKVFKSIVKEKELLSEFESGLYIIDDLIPVNFIQYLVYKNGLNNSKNNQCEIIRIMKFGKILEDAISEQTFSNTFKRIMAICLGLSSLLH